MQLKEIQGKVLDEERTIKSPKAETELSQVKKKIREPFKQVESSNGFLQRDPVSKTKVTSDLDNL